MQPAFTKPPVVLPMWVRAAQHSSEFPQQVFVTPGAGVVHASASTSHSHSHPGDVNPTGHPNTARQQSAGGTTEVQLSDVVLCSKCGQVLQEQYTEFNGKAFHAHCFSCKVCGQSLAGQKFVQRDGEVLCKECYQLHFSPRCASCGQPIHKKVYNALNQKWHEQCLYEYAAKKGLQLAA